MILVRDDGFEVSDDKARLDVPRIHHWLSEDAYWSLGRSMDKVIRSIAHSIVLGCYSPQGDQVGIARWVTDMATFGWLCDVYVDSAYRGRGLGKFLVQSAVDHPHLAGLRLRLLATKDAHDLYQRVGFVLVPEPGRWMELRT
jgi:GNAT superfamily N-acetyltransferase